LPCSSANHPGRSRPCLWLGLGLCRGALVVSDRPGKSWPGSAPPGCPGRPNPPVPLVPTGAGQSVLQEPRQQQCCFQRGPPVSDSIAQEVLGPVDAVSDGLLVDS